MALKVTHSKDVVLGDARQTVLLYGPPKTFKTRFALTSPNALVFDFDDGVKHFAQEFEFDYITYGTKPSEWDRFVQDAEEVFRKCTWDTLVFDSATTMSELLLSRLMLDSNKEMPTRDEYGKRAKIMGAMISKFAKMKENVNIIFICHETEMTDEAGALIKIAPYLPGQLRQNAGAQFDEVIRSEISKVKRDGSAVPAFRSSPNNLYERGSRQNLGDLEEPTWECFMKHVCKTDTTSAEPAKSEVTTTKK